MKKLQFFFIFILLLSLVSCNNNDSKKYNRENKESTSIKKETEINYSNITELDMPKDNIYLYIDGTKLDIKSPIYINKNRYYLCLNEIIKLLNGDVKKEEDILKFTINNNNYCINITSNTVTINNNTCTIKPLSTKDNKIYYIDFCDLAKIFDLYTNWNKDTKTIYCKTNANNIDNIKPYTASIDMKGFIRLEDVALSVQPKNNTYFEKLRVIGNYLSKRNVPYHMAWVPRAVYPSQNVDIDPTSTNDFAIAEMVYTLQFITEHNGLIGLHGYTHQSDNEESTIGFEFGTSHPDTARFRERIEAAINTANYLDIPISFFEAPHYAITSEQNKIAEEYFKIIYHPLFNAPVRTDNTKPQLSPYNNSSYYISTPLDYIKFDNVDASVENLKNCSTSQLGSIFYHPVLDFDYISLACENNIPSYNYADNSPLKRVVDILESKGFNLSKVSDIN